MWLITFVKEGKEPQVLVRKPTVQLIQIEKKKLEATGKYRTGKLQTRTEEGFKHVKFLNK